MFFFWISKNLFPKGKTPQPKNTRAQGPREQKKTDSTSPKKHRGENSPYSQQQKRTLNQAHTHIPGKATKPQPGPQPGQRQPGLAKTSPNQNRTINHPDNLPWPRIFSGKDHLSHIALFTGLSATFWKLEILN